MNTGGWKLLTIIFGSFVVVMLILTTIFGFRLVNFNKIKQTEVNNALKQQEMQLKSNFQAEKELTTTSYTADDIFGNFYFEYPKVWSTNVTQGSSDPLLRFMADPNLIVIHTDKTYNPSALRIETSSSSYTQKIKSYESGSNYNNKLLKEQDITVSGTKGKAFIGKTEKVPDKNSAIVVLPLRDKSIVISSDDYDTYQKQFQNVLDSFKLSR